MLAPGVYRVVPWAGDEAALRGPQTPAQRAPVATAELSRPEGSRGRSENETTAL